MKRPLTLLQAPTRPLCRRLMECQLDSGFKLNKLHPKDIQNQKSRTAVEQPDEYDRIGNLSTRTETAHFPMTTEKKASSLPQRIRSYVLRMGRMTAGQHRAIATLWPRYGVELENSPLDLTALFGRVAPCTLEIGFGMGDALLAMAEQHPEENFFGVEVHKPGVGRVLGQLQEQDLKNVRVATEDARSVLQQLPPASLDRVLLFFPDPWPKRKHHKRRIVQPEFIDQVIRVLKPGGCFHVATDWEPYAEVILETLSAHGGLQNQNPEGGFTPRPASRPETKFERRGQRLGHPVRDIVFQTKLSSA